MAFTKCITITFGEQVENHVGMQKLGQLAESGFTVEELREAQTKITLQGGSAELVALPLPSQLPVPPEEYKRLALQEEAAVLVIRNGAALFLGKEEKSPADALLAEQDTLTPDTKAKMYGRVVNKHARHNLCFAPEAQEPDYEAGKGRVVGWHQVPLLKNLQQQLPKFIGPKAADLLAEGNYYFDPEKCGLGFHGDLERRRVVALRLGTSIPLHYQWFYRGEPVGARVVINLNHGDMYVMSAKAVGNDWKRRVIPTLRHAAGSKKFTTITRVL